MRRRALLATLGSAMTVSTAGCLDTVADSLDDPIRLARLAVLNFDSRAHQFDLRVDRDGETVHRSSHQLRGKDDGRVYGEVADCTWGSTPGTYQIAARVDGGGWTRRPLADVDDGWRNTIECATAEVWYETEDIWIRLQDDCGRLTELDLQEGCAVERETSE